MLRMSRMERLQRGQVPLFNQSSLEQTLQKVCPQGMKAAPLFLPMHTQHTQSDPPFSALSVSSNSRINDTFLASPSSSSRYCRSAASAAARFMPEFRPGSSTWACWAERKGQAAPQQGIPLNLSRSFSVRLLRWPPSVNRPRIVLASLSLPTDSCSITPS
ncbi:hypothetical protein Fmac_013675 [Flemingia macrophylla]|uniref:Uncharacterized protein n=1 Tax=Flemingia macrophylla TaxID=520843 RepID=A0ABD1MTS9_9FABA